MNQEEEPKSLFGGKKFIKRVDLTPVIRHKIASIALLFNKRGVIINLSKRYNISRQFVYDLRDDLSAQNLFNGESSPSRAAGLKYYLLRCILYFRLVGICSLSQIEDLLSGLFLGKSSISGISSKLQEEGVKFSNTVTYKGKLTVVSDEIYANGKPILITVDPYSSAILRIDLVKTLTKEEWQNHWSGIEDGGTQLVGITKDDGVTMAAAWSTDYPFIPAQSDTFHAIAMKLGKYKKRLENAAYKSIEQVYLREIALTTAFEKNKEDTQLKKYKLLLDAEQKMEASIDLYEMFDFLYIQALSQLQLFTETGVYRDYEEAKSEYLLSIELLKSLSIKGKNIKKALDNLIKDEGEILNFLKKTPQVLIRLSAQLEAEILPFVCVLWQWNKNLIKSKTARQSQYFKRKIKEFFPIIEEYCIACGKQVQTVMQQVTFALDSILQSSALVETINSLVRPYLNAMKGQINQEDLNLIMFYLNHRVYKRGKRKGKAPIELLTGQKLNKGPIDLLMDKLNLV